jgi:hypothetical protein
VADDARSFGGRIGQIVKLDDVVNRLRFELDTKRPDRTALKNIVRDRTRRTVGGKLPESFPDGEFGR